MSIESLVADGDMVAVRVRSAGTNSEYREWPVCERGLAPVTVRASEQFVRRFLAGRACAGGSGWDHGRQGPPFLVRECARVSSGSAGS